MVVWRQNYDREVKTTDSERANGATTGHLTDFHGPRLCVDPLERDEWRAGKPRLRGAVDDRGLKQRAAEPGNEDRLRASSADVERDGVQSGRAGSTTARWRIHIGGGDGLTESALIWNEQR